MIPPNFRLATGVSKFTGESKPDTWLEDYRVAVQIGGGNDEVAMASRANRATVLCAEVE